jgi:hypothetical protein
VLLLECQENISKNVKGGFWKKALCFFDQKYVANLFSCNVILNKAILK